MKEEKDEVEDPSDLLELYCGMGNHTMALASKWKLTTDEIIYTIVYKVP
jgi:tRNA/tmRNA/rRNA uracil-C5-methylase (TrmA/RlmC/RlmD family)